MTTPRGGDDSLEVARGRSAPTFFILDDALTVTFASAQDHGSARPELPAEIRATVARLRESMNSSGETSAVAVSSPSEVVRVQRLDAKDGRPHYAVFFERFAVRNSVHKAAARFKLSSRETEVLEGLMRGESTNEIAARLYVAPTTVQEHIRKIGRKTNVTKRSEIVATVFDLR
jgi:DNA-binding NarL/FixJ family response regulator